jgi:Stress responsive A/B Barrel Domain
MLRRFESYAFDETATAEQIAELASALRRCGEFIPEVRDSIVGTNQSEADVALVWEHAYEDPDAYARYMCHPYHICVLDRFLLPESPECITAPRAQLGIGLMGYEIDDEPFRYDSGVRRLVAMKASADVDGAEWHTFVSALTALPELRVSIVAANAMGLEWFPNGWTHVWEQAYDDEDAMRRAIVDEAALLEAGPIDGWVDVWYRLDGVS